MGDEKKLFFLKFQHSDRWQNLKLQFYLLLLFSKIKTILLRSFAQNSSQQGSVKQLIRVKSQSLGKFFL